MRRSRSLIAVLTGAAVLFAAVGQTGAFVPTHPREAIAPTISSPASHVSETTGADIAAPAPTQSDAEPTFSEAPVDDPAMGPLPPMTVVAEAAGGYVVFVEGAEATIPGASGWPQAKLSALVSYYEEAVALYASDAGFGSTERWAAAFRISRDNPIRVVYAGNQPDPAPARASRIGGTAIVTHYTLRTSVRTVAVQLVIHELAHIWDNAHAWELGETIQSTVDNAEGFPTAKARDEGPKEDFAESVTATLWSGYAVNADWSDDGPGQRGHAADMLDVDRMFDRRNYVDSLFYQSQ